MGFIYGIRLNIRCNLPKTYFPTSWLSDQPAKDPNPGAEKNRLHFSIWYRETTLYMYQFLVRTMPLGARKARVYR